MAAGSAPKTPAQKLRADLAYWQRRLRLRDWTITAKFVYESQLDNRSAVAETKVSLEECRADVRIQHPDELKAIAYGPLPEPEVSLVHELLHVRLEPARLELAEGSSARPQLEAAIDITARVLVDLRHGRR